jgi:hypothetical protein
LISQNGVDELRSLDPEIAKLGGLFPQVLCELEHYRDNPRFLLVLSCSFAELMIGTLIEARCKNGKGINDNVRDFPFSVRLTLLREMNVLHEAHFIWLNWLRKQRNDAAHKPEFRFTVGKLRDWGGEQHRTPDKLFSLCTNILAGVWNQHLDLFQEKLPIEFQDATIAEVPKAAPITPH